MQEMEQMHSLVLASEYEAEDVEAMWSSLTEQRTELAHMGVRHVVVYTSIWEPNRVFVTVGIRHRHSVPEVLRSGAIVDWFDRAGIEDIPAVFAGEVINKIDYYGPTPAGAASGVIVGVVTPVQDVPALMKNIDDSRDRFMAAGFRKLWVYGAFDDPREVMILVEISRESSARQWIDHADPAAEWMSNAGIAGYPPLFVGKIAHVMTLETCDRQERSVFVCLCNAVTTQLVHDAVAQGASTSKEVAAACGAGTECGRCRRTVRTLIAAYRAASDPAPSAPGRSRAG